MGAVEAMELEKKKDIGSLSNKIGGVIFLALILNKIILACINAAFKIPESTIPAIAPLITFFSFVIPSMFILKIKPKKMISKSSNELEGIKNILPLLVFLTSINCIFSLGFNYLSGIGKVANVVLKGAFGEGVFVIIGIGTAAIFEEIIFRGIILENLKKYGELFAIIVSAVIFGLMHGIRFGHSFIAGLILGFIYVITGTKDFNYKNLDSRKNAHFYVC